MFRKFRKRAEISSPNLSSDENDRAKRQLFVQRSSKKARVSLNSRKSECNSVQKNKFEKKQENFYPELCLFLAERRKIWEKITWKNLDAGDRVSVASMGQILASGGGRGGGGGGNRRDFLDWNAGEMSARNNVHLKIAHVKAFYIWYFYENRVEITYALDFVQLTCQGFVHVDSPLKRRNTYSAALWTGQRIVFNFIKPPMVVSPASLKVF